MSTPHQGPIRRAVASYSRWRNTSRGTSTLKAAYAQAARDAKRMDPTVRERIGRANMTKADLQQLAESHVAGAFRPENAAHSEYLNTRATQRVVDAGLSAPPRTWNPVRMIRNKLSRRQDLKQGTAALKQAYAQAARDVKKMDPAVREAIGRSKINKHDLKAFSQANINQVFRPEGNLGAIRDLHQSLTGQQAQNQAQNQTQPEAQAGQVLFTREQVEVAVREAVAQALAEQRQAQAQSETPAQGQAQGEAQAEGQTQGEGPAQGEGQAQAQGQAEGEVQPGQQPGQTQGQSQQQGQSDGQQQGDPAATPDRQGIGQRIGQATRQAAGTVSAGHSRHGVRPRPGHSRSPRTSPHRARTRR